MKKIQPKLSRYNIDSRIHTLKYDYDDEEAVAIAQMITVEVAIKRMTMKRGQMLMSKLSKIVEEHENGEKR